MPQTRAFHYSDDGAIDHTPASAVTAGDVVVIGNSIVGVAPNDIPANTKGAISIEGIKKVPKQTGAWVAGLPVFWNPSGTPVNGSANSGAANQVGIGTYMGIAAEAAVSGDAHGAVILNQRTGVVGTSTVAATGSTQADAAQIGTGFVLATAGDGTKGVLLPAAAPGLQVTVKNGAAAILKVYPATGDVVNALSANAAISMASNTSAVFTAYDATTWYTNPLLPS